MVPSSQQMKNQIANDQDQGREINKIKRLIIENDQARPTISEFETPEQRVFYKQYSSLHVVDGILYRQTEDKFGINQIQLIYRQGIRRGIRQGAQTGIQWPFG